MSLRVLIAPDKFKGTLTAQSAAAAIAAGWRKARPADRLTLLPISDGGDGFGEILSAALGAKLQHTQTVDAAHRPLAEGAWWWAAESKTAVIESAKIIGLAMLPPKQFHPFQLDTFGLAAVLRAAKILPACTLVRFDRARHELFCETDEIRDAWLKAIDDFIGAHLVAVPVRSAS